MDLTQNALLKPAVENSAQPSKKSSNCMTTLFWHPTGPLLKYVDGFLHVEDLNPHVKTQWRMSRAEMLWLGWRCLIAACKHKMWGCGSKPDKHVMIFSSVETP